MPQRRFNNADDFLFSFTQRRQLDTENIQPKKEIFSEQLFSAQQQEITVRRGDYPTIDFVRNVASDPKRRSVLQKRE